MRFDQLERDIVKQVVNEDGQTVEETVKGKLTKKEKQKLFVELCTKGPRVVIDCDFDSMMRENEIKSLAQQLCYCTNVNKQLATPMNLIFTGIGEQLLHRLETNNYQNWAIQAFSGDDSSYLDAKPVQSIYNTTDDGRIDKSKLVYLTADSKNDIKELDPEDVYIIGGIVDRNRYVNLTLKKAEEEGIRHGRFPIGDYMQLKSSTVLTVNQVFQILGLQFNTKDWNKTLNEVIPERKQIKPEDEIKTSGVKVIEEGEVKEVKVGDNKEVKKE